jgi:hypothetical protein
MRSTRWANSSTSCSKPPGNILEAVEEIADLTPDTRPVVRPESPSPTPVPMPVAISPMMPPLVVVVVVVDDDVPLVELVPLPVLPPLLLPPNRSVTRPPNMFVKKEPTTLPMSEKIVVTIELPELAVLVLLVFEVVLLAGVVVAAADEGVAVVDLAVVVAIP